MFQVSRWPGPSAAAADDTSERRERKRALFLQHLNAKARERALSRRSEAVVEGVTRVDDDGAALRSGTVNGDLAPCPDQHEADAARKPVPTDSRKEKKKERTKRKIDESSQNVEDGLGRMEFANAPPSDKKAAKKSKIKIPLAPELKTVTENGLVGQLNGADVDEVKVLPAEHFRVPRREKTGKKRRNPSSQREDLTGSLENVEEPPSMPDVSGSLLPASVACDGNGEPSHAILDNLSERADGGAPGSTLAKGRKNKKGKVFIEAATALETEANTEEDRNPIKVAGVPLEKNDIEPVEVFDLSRVERDVEMIMGKSSHISAEGHAKGPPVLPWMRDPLEIGSYSALPLNRVPGLDIRLQDALRRTGVAALFPVQVAVWNETVGPGRCERDLCVCSPTGSGKTLSYALPLVQKLSTRVIRRLRALIVLPTRDLASQVHAVFDAIAPSVGLKVGLAVGQTSIVAEAAELVKLPKKVIHSFGETGGYDLAESGVDILVATPGRLMDHLRNTKEFTLQHLLYLVVDETDRLLRQSYQDWLSNVLRTVEPTEFESRSNVSNGPLSLFSGSLGRSLQTIRHVGVERGIKGSMFPRLMKLVLSATLTRDPSKIAQLALHRPMYIAQSAVDNRYQLPEKLQAMKLICRPGEKPLYLVALLQQMSSQQSIVFTASVVATHRLFTFLNAFEGLSFKVVEYSSLQHQQARSRALSKFRDGEAQVLVASDGMTRGMDVEGVGNVVNYDMPVYAKTYVHRVGRTARAGRSGCSYTLLRKEEVRHFKSLLKKADNSSCKDFRIPAAETQQLYERYITALGRLREVIQEESTVTSTPASKESKSPKLPAEEAASGPDELFM